MLGVYNGGMVPLGAAEAAAAVELMRPHVRRPRAREAYSLLASVLTTYLPVTSRLLNVGRVECLWMEFGTFMASSTNATCAAMAGLPELLHGPQAAQCVVHGFDTFTGLPSAWLGMHKGREGPKTNLL